MDQQALKNLSSSFIYLESLSTLVLQVKSSDNVNDKALESFFSTLYSLISLSKLTLNFGERKNIKFYQLWIYLFKITVRLVQKVLNKS